MAGQERKRPIQAGKAGEEQKKPKQAIALEYDPSEEAPRVIASGRGELAEQRIRRAATRNVRMQDGGKGEYKETGGTEGRTGLCLFIIQGDQDLRAEFPVQAGGDRHYRL